MIELLMSLATDIKQLFLLQSKDPSLHRLDHRPREGREEVDAGHRGREEVRLVQLPQSRRSERHPARKRISPGTFIAKRSVEVNVYSVKNKKVGQY